MTARKKGVSGVDAISCFAWMVVVLIGVGVFVIPAAFLGHLIRFTPSVSDLLSGHNLDKKYPLAVLRFAVVDVAILVVLASSVKMRSVSLVRADVGPPASAHDIAEALGPTTLSPAEAVINAPDRRDAEPTGRSVEQLCDLYLERGEPDAVIDSLSRCTFSGSGLWKAQALRDKGLKDAALAVYDDCIREGKKRRVKLEHIARYRKADLLLEIGDMARARRELGRLYADDPTYEDYARLLDKIRAPSASASREPIPEQVRHAV